MLNLLMLCDIKYVYYFKYTTYVQLIVLDCELKKVQQNTFRTYEKVFRTPVSIY